MQCGTGHYKQLMAQFNIVTEVFLSLDEQYQEVIADITKRMGAGMADFIQQEVRRDCGRGLVPACIAFDKQQHQQQHQQHQQQKHQHQRLMLSFTKRTGAGMSGVIQQEVRNPVWSAPTVWVRPQAQQQQQW
jgi:hypothetical protein